MSRPIDGDGTSRYSTGNPARENAVAAGSPWVIVAARPITADITTAPPPTRYMARNASGIDMKLLLRSLIDHGRRSTVVSVFLGDEQPGLSETPHRTS